MISEKILNKINNKKPKYYNPCSIPLTTRILSKRNFSIYTSLLSLDGGTAIPNVVIRKDGSIHSNVSYSRKLSSFSIFQTLGIVRSIQNFENFLKGIDYIKEKLNKDEEVMLAVSCFYLPYSKDFMNMDYFKEYEKFGIHYISVTDINESSIRVYDTTPKIEDRWIKLEDFERAWEGDGAFKFLKDMKNVLILNPYSYYEIEILQNKVDILEFSLLVLKKNIENLVVGKKITENEEEFYFGELANIMLIDLSRNALLENNWSKISQISLSLNESKFSRFFLRDYLSDISLMLPELDIFRVEIESCIKNFERLTNRLNIEINKKSYDIKKIKILEKKIEKYFKQELSLYLKMDTYLEKMLGVK
ncbi:cysteine peptidase family C39 domain-containing protein [Pseudolactococcus reticulitermitis]|uniref:Butirosin biosynthesis protein H N-terminal domain-containing protein n=1 Tax=Pseudolactococcus reticulitermitis TaxID=2025039 RepID=A0A224X9L8_9LACT|nr:hypothetical protein [Lactococcus reticulitermitis]GAX46874.1 hypothetical protein RsY01_454 [Lactococcus reticulitermitis]